MSYEWDIFQRLNPTRERRLQLKRILLSAYMHTIHYWPNLYYVLTDSDMPTAELAILGTMWHQVKSSIKIIINIGINYYKTNMIMSSRIG